MTAQNTHKRDYSQGKRSIEHVLPLGFAFSLTIFPLWLVFVLSVTAVIYGAYLSKRLSKTTFRDDEKKVGYSVGKIAYGVSVLILLLLFYRQMHIVAGAWAIMALGDPAATLAGRRWGRKPVPWNPAKTWTGTLAFFIFATSGCFGLLWYTVATTKSEIAVTVPVLMAMAVCTAAVTAIIESVDFKINDNFTVPLSAGILLFVQTKIWIL